MKKLFFIAATIMLSVTATQAQEVRLGAKGGVNFANLGGDIDDADSRTGFHIGALVEIPVTERFSVQPEVLYSAQGAKYEESGTELGVDYLFRTDLKLDYIQVPVMAKFYVAEGFAIEAGPQIGFLASSKAESESTIGGVTVKDEGDIEDISSIDFGLGAGVSYRLPMGVFFGARYNHGLSNINDSGDDKVNNSVFQLSAGYSF